MDRPIADRAVQLVRSQAVADARHALHALQQQSLTAGHKQAAALITTDVDPLTAPP